MNRTVLFLLLFRAVIRLSAQTPDSVLIFSEEQFFNMILTHHPVVRQANLLDAEAEAYLRKARGGFDPKLSTNLNQKSFDGKRYFTLGQAGMKVPSWYGVEFKAGYNWSNGAFLNPENKLPLAGQAELGLSVNLLQGVVIDQRRAVLQQARIMRDLNEAGRRAMVNDILLEANEAYWDWVFAHRTVRIYEEAVRLARVRLAGTIVQFEQGYKPAIDTLESGILLQTREAELLEARIARRNARLRLSNFLWTNDDTPLEISETLSPPPLTELPVAEMSTDELQLLVFALRNEHPELLQYRYQLDQLEVERKLKAEMLKPQLTVSYNLLGDGWNLNNGQNNDASSLHNLFLENYKWGVEFNFPLFLRKERGDLQLTTIKTRQTELKRQQKQLELNNKLLNYYNDLNNFAGQIDMFEQMVRDYTRLLQAENDRFSIGESSIFLVNSREQKLIETQLKLAALQAKYQKAKVALEGVAGRLF